MVHRHLCQRGCLWRTPTLTSERMLVGRFLVCSGGKRRTLGCADVVIRGGLSLATDDEPFYWEYHICWEAAASGHLEVRKWARARGYRWDSWTCFQAAIEGRHLHVIKWAHENGCAVDEQVSSAAAGQGNLNDPPSHGVSGWKNPRYTTISLYL